MLSAPLGLSAPCPISRSFYSGAPTRHDDVAQRRWFQRALSAAMLGNQLAVHYQPRVCLATGGLTAAEALLRWPHRKRGFIPPATFVPVAEQTGQITPLGGWVLLTACQEAAHWGGAQVSVNVSARQMQDGALLDQVAAALEASGLMPEQLVLELTEAVLMDVSLDTLLTLSAIRDLGVGIALDDFGSGRASLSMLKRLPLTVLKLDRSMLRDLPHDRDDAAIARAIVDTGHALGFTVVAEGIETEDQRAFMSAIGCDEAQGYLFSPALPAEAWRARLSGASAGARCLPRRAAGAHSRA